MESTCLYCRAKRGDMLPCTNTYCSQGNQCINCRIMSGDIPLDNFEYSIGNGSKQKLKCMCDSKHPIYSGQCLLCACVFIMILVFIGVHINL